MKIFYPASKFIVLLIFLLFYNDSQSQTEYFAENGSFSAFTHIIHPAAQYYNGKTYIVYQGENFNSYITYYNHSTKKWSNNVKIGEDSLAKDGHGSPSLLIDNSGYLHVLYGAHTAFVQHIYYRTTNPDDISSWQKMPSIPTATNYPQLMQLTTGEIFVFFRDGGHTANWSYGISMDNGQSWGDVIPVLEGTTEDFGWYAMFTKSRYDDTIHAAFVSLTETGEFRGNRYNVYYMVRDIEGNWQNSYGQKLNTPLSLDAAKYQAKVYDSGSEITQVPWLSVDEDGNANMVFTSGTNEFMFSGDYKYKFAKWSDSEWIVKDIGVSTDYIFDLYSMDVRTSQIIDAYLVTGLTKNAGGMIDRGGNLEKWSSTDGGENWEFSELIGDSLTIYNDPQVVRNHNNESVFVFSQQPSVPTYWDLLNKFENKVYLYGDNGFVKKGLGTAVDPDGDNNILPAGYELSQNYPNPFNPETVIAYLLPHPEFVEIIVFDVLGKLVKNLVNGNQTSGRHSINWDGTNDLGMRVTSGTYFYQLRTGKTVLVRKMQIIK